MGTQAMVAEKVLVVEHSSVLRYFNYHVKNGFLVIPGDDTALRKCNKTSTATGKLKGVYLMFHLE